MSQRQHTKTTPPAKTPLARALWPLYLLGAVVFLGLAAFAIGSGGSNTSSVTPAATGGPRLKADREQIDLGDVKLGKMVAATFVLTNTGEKLVRFTEAPYIEVKEGC